MMKSKIAQATLVLESPVGGLVIAMKSFHQTIAPCLNVQERRQHFLEEWLVHGDKIVEIEIYSIKARHLN